MGWEQQHCTHLYSHLEIISQGTGLEVRQGDPSSQKVLWGLSVGQQPDRPKASLDEGRNTFYRGREENCQVVSLQMMPWEG